MTTRTTVISVAYNSTGVIGDMLASVPSNTPVVVVDNDSSDDLAGVLAGFPDAQLISMPENLGFGRACNAGAATADTEFLMFLNPDATLSVGALKALEDFADANPDMGAANPLIRNASGKARIKMSSPLPIPKMTRPTLETAGQMPVLTGGAFFTRRSIFEAIGGFDPDIFLYHEDHDLSRRIVAAGHSLWHVPSAIADHIAGTGSPRTESVAAWKGYCMGRSRVYVIEKFAPGHGFSRTFWPGLLGLLGPTNLFSKRRRAKYLGILRGALSARKDGGRFIAQ